MAQCILGGNVDMADVGNITGYQTASVVGMGGLCSAPAITAPTSPLLTPANLAQGTSPIVLS